MSLIELEEKLLNEIKAEFLNMAEEGHVGYNISLNKTCKWLGIDYNDNYRRNFKSRYLKNIQYYFQEAENENDKNGDYLIKMEGPKNTTEEPYFSNDGFKLVCLVLKHSPKAQLVRKYFINIEQEP